MEFASNKPLQMLRELLKEQQIDAFIVGSGDAHLSEYVSSADLRRAFISNFDGSAGTALILQDRALLWTDGRYFLQAGKQLSSEWTLMKSGQPGVLEMAEWVAENLVRGQCVGVDSMLIPVGEARSLSNSFSKKGVELRAVDKNPVDTVWSTLGRPQVPPTPIRVMGLHLTGLSHPEKIGTVRDFIQKQGAQALLVTALDDVAWLFNFRGADVECNPVALSFAMVTVQTTYLFIDMAKVTDEAREHFGSSVILLPYTEVGPYVTEQAALGLVLMDFAQVNWGLSLCAGENSKSITNPIVLAKSIKNPTELEGFRQAHIRDGVALTAFFHWLEGAVKGGESVSEWQVTEILEKFRGKMKDHVGPSFGTIAAYGSNGAMMHYSPARETSAILGRESTYLQDSGAQYLDGTTDVTRTFHFGTPSPEIRHCYTAVLQGHIALATAVFPEGTLGSRIDCLARLSLWQSGLDYNHGTGHGVGSFLNVHEGPQGIGFRRRPNEVGYFAGMTTSNEPGYYQDGHFGIRIENLCITVPKKTPFSFNDKQHVGFETVTLAPIALNMVDMGTLTPKEVQWLNEYHAQVRSTLAPLMQEHFPDAVAYLMQGTEPIVL